MWAPVTAPSPCASGVQVGSMLEPGSPIKGEGTSINIYTHGGERQEKAPCLDFMREDSFGFGAHGGRQKESQHREEKWT